MLYFGWYGLPHVLDSIGEWVTADPLRRDALYRDLEVDAYKYRPLARARCATDLVTALDEKDPQTVLATPWGS